MEMVFNLYIFYDDAERALYVGHVIYSIEGTDEEKISFLKNKAVTDYKFATLVPAPVGLNQTKVNALARTGETIKLFSHVFTAHPTHQPIICITPVVNGVPKFNYEASHEPLNMEEVDAKFGDRGHMIDWMQKYIIGDEFNSTQLINDDYFEAIKLLFNSGMYVSASKLLLSCIDSLAFVEYGYIKGNAFVQWLNTYADLTPIDTSSQELWEYRNGLLHMSNLNSREVRKNKIRRVSVFVGENPLGAHMSAGEVHYFDLKKLIDIIANAIRSWLSSYDADRGKFVNFVERYDEVVSDSRMARIILGEAKMEKL
ncbi:hypothetical protein HX867_15995 [Pseudomonas gingeri]|uniref:hypothetical protein n=1 Tax=Pseudomonas gingeri TaxID=117681 RepID=UPI0015A3960E|nr:hypothetical protein [Pseudomonas gingeri]NVZ63596.1 hypothetical protein [Pseudomonas gingeri]